MAEALAQHFASVGSNMNRSEEFIRHKEKEESREIRLEEGDGEDYNEEITMRKLVSCLNAARDTSPGRNEIAYKIIRHTDESFKKLFLTLYNRVYAEHNTQQMVKLHYHTSA